MSELAETLQSNRLPLAGEMAIADDATIQRARNATHLFVVGAQKAGTTWLASYLQSHPDALLAAKELNYFSSIDRAEVSGIRLSAKRFLAMSGLRKGPSLSDDSEAKPGPLMMKNFQTHQGSPREHEMYLRFLYGGYDGESVVCDVSPAYSGLSPNGFAKMREVAERTKFVLFLRDPLDRLWSQVKMRSALTKQDDIVSVVQSVIADIPKPGRDRTDYRRMMGNIQSAIPEGDILVQFYETFFDTQKVSDITDFIGLQAYPGDFDTKVVPRASRGKSAEYEMTAALRKMMMDELRPIYDWAFERFGERIPERWYHNVRLTQ